MTVLLYLMGGEKCGANMAFAGAEGQPGCRGGCLAGPGATVGSASQITNDSHVLALAVKPGKAVRCDGPGGGTAPEIGLPSDPRMRVGSGLTERYRVDVV